MLSYWRTLSLSAVALVATMAPLNTLADGKREWSSRTTVNCSPFGVHSAFAHAIGGDPFEPAREAGIGWTRGADAPYVYWALVDPERSGDPRSMRFSGTTVGPDGSPARFDYDASIARVAAVTSGEGSGWPSTRRSSRWHTTKKSLKES